MRVARVAASLAFLATACGTAQPLGSATVVAAVPSEPPTVLDGHVLVEGPLRSLDPQAPRAWRELGEILADRGPAEPTTVPTSPREYRAWMHEVVVPWMHALVRRVDRLRTWLSALTVREPAGRLFVSVVGARAVAHLAERVAAVPLTPGFDDGGAREVWLEELLRGIEPQIAHARASYGECVATARGRSFVIASWGGICARAEQELVALATPTPPSPPRGELPPWPSPCDVRQTFSVREAPPLRTRAPPVVAVFDATRRFEGHSREQLVAAVTRVIRSRAGGRVVPRREVRRAERLVAESRLPSGGCAIPPSPTRLLGPRHPHVVIASITAACPPSGGGTRSGCALEVLRTTAGAEPDGPISPWLAAVVERTRESSIDGWIDAARRLAEPESPAEIVGMDRSSGRVAVLDEATTDPLLDVGFVLSIDFSESLASCAPRGGVAAYQLELDVARTGETTSVRATPLPMLSSNDAGARCIEEALALALWTCPSSETRTTVRTRVCVRR